MIHFIDKPDEHTVDVEVFVECDIRDARIFLKVAGSRRIFIGWLSPDGTLWRSCLEGKDLERLQEWGFKFGPRKDRIALGNPD